jgi:hypothetical protein
MGEPAGVRPGENFEQYDYTGGAYDATFGIKEGKVVMILIKTAAQ